MTIVYILLAVLCLFFLIFNIGFWMMGGFEELTGITMDGLIAATFAMTMVFVGTLVGILGIAFFINKAVGG